MNRSLQSPKGGGCDEKVGAEFLHLCELSCPVDGKTKVAHVRFAKGTIHHFSRQELEVWLTRFKHASDRDGQENYAALQEAEEAFAKLN